MNRIDPNRFRIDPIEWPVTTTVGPGLAGAVVNETTVAGHDGAGGEVVYRGVGLAKLAGRPFEEVAFLVLSGNLPAGDTDGWKNFSDQVVMGRCLPPEMAVMLEKMPLSVPPIRVLRLGLSVAGALDGEGSGPGHWLGRTSALVEMLVTGARKGVEASSGREGLAYSALVQMGRGKEGDNPTDEEVALLERCWVLGIDHDLDPAVFAGYVVTSCGAGPGCSLPAFCAGLPGRRLAGAGEELMRILQSLPGPQAAREWVAARLQEGRRLPGFGHPVHRGSDPRLALLREPLREALLRRGQHALYEVVLALEEEGNARLGDQGLFPNRLLHTAAVYLLLGATPRHFCLLESIPRVVGLLARIEECREDLRLVRPRLESVVEKEDS